MICLLALVLATPARAFHTEDLLSVIAMPLAVAAVSDVTGVSQTDLANLVATLNNANVPPMQVVHVLRYVPVALVSNNGPRFVQFVQEQTTQGVTGPALVPVVVKRLQTFYPAQTQVVVQPPPMISSTPPPVVLVPKGEDRGKDRDDHGDRGKEGGKGKGHGKD